MMTAIFQLLRQKMLVRMDIKSLNILMSALHQLKS